jgi:hypothetical protein
VLIEPLPSFLVDYRINANGQERNMPVVVGRLGNKMMSLGSRNRKKGALVMIA